MSYIDPSLLVEKMKSSANMFPQQVLAESIVGKEGTTLEESIKNNAMAVGSYAQELYKRDEFKPHLADMKESWSKKCVAICMENWRRATKYLDEATAAAAIANFNKDMFPLIRSVLPATATEKAFTIQPMLGPTSNIFTFQPTYGTTTGKVNAGDSLFQNHDPNYGDSVIDNEVLATAAALQVNFTGNLSNTPVVAGSVVITDGSQVITDDGAGNLVGDVGAGTNTINYVTGAINVDFLAAPGAGVNIEVSYTVDNETNTAGIPEVDLVLTQTPVTARRKAIRFRYSLVSSFSLRDQYGLDGESELTKAVAAEIAYGIDTNNFRTVVRAAVDKTADTDFQFDRTTPSGISFTEYKFELIDYIIKGSTFIHTNSGRVVGNWMVAPDLVTNILESIGKPRFQPQQVRASRGIQWIGTLDDRWEIFRIIDPANIGLGTDEYLMGHKPSEFLFAGYVWAPWIAAFETPTTILDDFQARKGMASLYGQKLINNKYYLKLKTTKS